MTIFKTLIVIAIVTITAVIIGESYYKSLPVDTIFSPTLVPSVSKQPIQTPTSTPNIINKNITTQPSSQKWIWENLGCGSSVPCSYRVCSSVDATNCYSCGGHYNKLSPEGEKLPTEGEDPRTTTDFTCKPITSNL